MHASDYQYEASKTAIYAGQHTLSGLMYVGLGLTSEAGEVAGKIKKLYRDRAGVNTTYEPRMEYDEIGASVVYDEICAYSDDVVSAIKAEVGDVLWYLAQVANELQFDLEDAMIDNIRKLKSRQERDVLGGAGDDR